MRNSKKKGEIEGVKGKDGERQETERLKRLVRD